MRLAAACCWMLLSLAVVATSWAADGNRLVYLDESDPFYVSRSFPKLVDAAMGRRRRRRGVVIVWRSTT